MDALALEADLTASANLIRGQLNVSFYHDLAQLLGISSRALFDMLGIPPAVTRRWKERPQLTVIESDYAFHQALLLRAALGLFEGDNVQALRWMTQPNRALDNAEPSSLVSTFVGINVVKALIWKIENGVCP